MSATLENIVKLGFEELGLPLEEKAAGRYRTYFEYLEEMNRVMNLTAISGEEDVARLHFLDCAVLARQFPMEGKSLIDVGTGAGFPGLPLAIARPDLQVTLLEAQGKRCKFLAAVCEALQLQNVEIINERAEILGRAEGHRESYDRAVARAVAPLNILCEYLLPFVQPGGCALCWKGPAVYDEMADGQAAAQALGGEMGRTLETPAPGMETKHIVVEIIKIEKTLPQYPRKNGIPAKRPLKKGK